jgi:adenine C2-methylase RlmN of 23S rRNA A2503 and tRNA A37
MRMNPATYGVHSVVMRSNFWTESENRFITYEYTLDAREWRQLQKAYRLARLIPFTSAATWAGAELESLICGHTPERYTRIN